MVNSRDNAQGRGGFDESDEVVRAEDMADRDRMARGVPVESHTYDPPVNAVRGEVRRQEAPREEVLVRQEPVRVERALGGNRALDIPESYALDHDRVRWPAVFAGLLAALTTLIALGVLGLAVGLTSIDAGEAVAQSGVPSGLGLGSGLWAGVSALLAVLLGGWVAGRTAAVFGQGWGALNGMLVFLLAVPVTLWLASSGVGALLGSFSQFVQDLNPGQVAQDVTPEQATEAARNARNAAWATLLGLGLGIGAATLGGLLGTRSEVKVDHDEVARAREAIVRQ